MNAAVAAQMKVAIGADELARVEALVDLEHPDDERRLYLRDSLDLIDERFGEAIRPLGIR